MSLTEKKHNNTIEVVDISDEGNEDQLLQNSHANDKEATLPSTENIQISNVATIPVIDLSDDDGENFDANEKEQTPPRKRTYEELLQNFSNLRRSRMIEEEEIIRNLGRLKKMEEEENSSEKNDSQPKNKKKGKNSGQFEPSPTCNPSTSQSVFQEVAFCENKNDKAQAHFDTNDFQPKTQPRKRKYVGLIQHYRNEQDKKKSANIEEAQTPTDNKDNQPTNKKQRRDSGEFCPLAKRNPSTPSTSQSVFQEAALGDNKNDKPLQNSDQNDFQPKAQTGPSNKSPKTRPRTFISRHVRETSNFIEQHLALVKSIKENIHLQALLVQKDKVLENCEKERIDMNLTLISKHKELEICKQEIKTVNKQLRKKKKEQKKQKIKHDKQLKQALQKAKRESQLEQQKVIDHMQEINDFQVQMISAYKELGHGAHSDQTTSSDKLVNSYQVLTDLQEMISSYKELGHGEHSDQTTSPDKLVNCYQVLTELQDQTIELLKASCKEHIKKNA
jgi:hypothetical protein